MYIWRIDRLKRELALSVRRDSATVPYIIAYLVLLAFCTELARLVEEPLDTWRAVNALLVMTSAGAGTYVVYRANGGRDGRDFPNRFFPLSFVFGVRFFVAAGSALPAMHVWWEALGLRVEEVRWFGTLVLLVLVLIYYGRLAAHVRHVAQAADGRGFHRSMR